MLSLLAPFGAPMRQELPAVRQEATAPAWNEEFRAVASTQQQASMIMCVSVPPYQTAANDQWCEQSCNREGLKTKTCSSTICKCGGSELRTAPSEDGDGYEEEEQQQQQEEGCQRYVSSGGATTDEWCTSYCATDEGCPPDVADVCKCADDVKLTTEEQQAEQKVKDQFNAAEHDFSTTWTEEAQAQDRLNSEEDERGETEQMKESKAAVIKQQEDMLRQRKGMQQAADAAVAGLPYNPAQRQQQQRQQQQASLVPEQQPEQQVSEQQAFDDGFPMCVSITVDQTNGACQTACATKKGCPPELQESCKCGDEAIDNLDKASAATAERESAAAQTNAEVRGGVSNAEADTLAGQDSEEERRNEIPVLPTLDTTNYCPAMSEITADQLRCVFGMLDMGRAEMYAAAATNKLGGTLTTACEWAAFLGNVAIESKELTIWKELECATSPPYCGRGPLQITSLKNYDFCATNDACNCPDIVNDLEKPATDAAVGFGTAACVWAGVFGYSLSQLADGTRDGFLKTCCTIHQGHYPCMEMEQYDNREKYWSTATTCFGAIEKRVDEAAAAAEAQGQNSDWADRKEANNGGGWAASDEGWDGNLPGEADANLPGEAEWGGSLPGLPKNTAVTR